MRNTRKGVRGCVRSQNGASAISEMGVALFVFFFFALFPLINLVAYATGAATVWFMSVQCAGGAANSRNFPEALQTVQNLSDNLRQGGFGKFAKLISGGGYNGCGTDLYTTVTEIATAQALIYGPNQPFAGTIDTTKYIYEATACAQFEAEPFLPLGSIPFINNVPIVGKRANLVFVCNRAMEDPEILLAGGSGQQQSGGGGGGPGGGGSGGGTSGGQSAGSTIGMGSGSGNGMPSGNGGGQNSSSSNSGCGCGSGIDSNGNLIYCPPPPNGEPTY